MGVGREGASQAHHRTEPAVVSERKPMTAPLTDLEMTRLCAEAMGYQFVSVNEYAPGILVNGIVADTSRYDPLHDKAQCLSLVEKCKLTVKPSGDAWDVYYQDEYGYVYFDAADTDLRRAIVECAARMQQAKGA